MKRYLQDAESSAPSDLKEGRAAALVVTDVVVLADGPVVVVPAVPVAVAAAGPAADPVAVEGPVADPAAGGGDTKC